MARYKNGIMGAFSGKVGAVVGASWRGIDYMRGKPRPSNKPATDDQLAQRLKMTLFRGFLIGMDPVIESCFQNYAQKTPMNGALSHNMKYAVTGEYPDLNIDFPNVLFSQGNLMGPWSPEAESVENNMIFFSWENGAFNPMRGAADKADIVVYNPGKQQFSYLKAAASRTDKMASLIIPKDFSGDKIHCYLSFYNEKLKYASTTEYLGEILVI